MLLQTRNKELAGYYAEYKNANVVQKKDVYLIFVYNQPIKGEYDELKKEFYRYHRGIISRVELVIFIAMWQKAIS